MFSVVEMLARNQLGHRPVRLVDFVQEPREGTRASLRVRIRVVAAAGYAYVGNRSANELAVLRARADFARQIEDRVATMTPTERRQFDTRMKQAAAAKR
jgi:hypothetical protein